MKLLRFTAETYHVDHSRHLFELSFKNPVLHDLEIHQAAVFPDQLIAIDLAYRGRRRQFRPHAGRQVRHLQPVENFLAIEVVVRFVLEVTLDVSQNSGWSAEEMERQITV